MAAPSIPDASHLPPGMALLPSGKQMPADQFFALHGAELAAYPDAQIAVAVPAFAPSDNLKEAMKGLVGLATAALATAILKSPTLSTIAGTAVGNYVGTPVAGWIAQRISEGAHVKVFTVRQMMAEMHGVAA